MNTLQKIKKVSGENIDIDVDAIVPEARLIQDLDIDSLTLVHLVTVIEEEFEVEITDEQLDNMKTVQDVINYIEENLKGI